jgi:replicative DNA helicase
MSEKNFGYLGHKFQISLLNLLITDKKFSHTIIHTIDAKYFDNQYYRLIAQMIKDFAVKHDSIPSFDVLDILTLSEIPSEMARQCVVDVLKEVKGMSLDIGEISFYKEKSLKFCKQQELHKAIKKVDNMIKKGDFENYDKAEELIRTALQVGIQDEEDTADVFDNLEEVLSPDFRHPIPTGISGIDGALGGGLGKGELGVILAPTGVGKSTITTLFANHAYKQGYNVLHIFFEDQKKQIQRKHICGITGISPNDQDKRVDEIKKMIETFRASNQGKLILRKYPSEQLTFQDLKTRILKIIAEGNKIDLLIIDYIDCIISGGEEWANEGTLMRQIESLGHEIDVATWVATQGNRSSIGSDVVTTDQMGGSIKKAQVGHVIVTIAKNLNQRENRLATVAITKSRIGPDGIVFENCRFDNEYLDIDTDTCSTLLGFEENKEEEQQRRTQERIRRATAQRQQNNTNNRITDNNGTNI